ncbi:MAG: hypothetical protein V3U96_04485 [Paracoccaceae bacterium]
MALFDDSYSRIVTWLKILFPLTALAILSTLFLASKSNDLTTTLPFGESELRDIAREPKIRNPAFSGVTSDGSAIDFSAALAVPLISPEAGLKANGLKGVYETPDGRVVNISANTGVFDTIAGTAVLEDGVSLTTSTGYLIKTDAIIADMNRSRISTTGEIIADGPLGHIIAGQLALQQEPGEDAVGYQLKFSKGVKLIYTPAQQ